MIFIDFYFQLKGTAKGAKGANGEGSKAIEESKTNKVKTEPFSFPDDQGSSNSGFYELQAVLTHKGRSSSSGHYVAWTRRKGGRKIDYINVYDYIKEVTSHN